MNANKGGTLNRGKEQRELFLYFLYFFANPASDEPDRDYVK
jgi:hypothetical protein